MMSCWSALPPDRPTFNELTALLQSDCNPFYVNIDARASCMPSYTNINPKPRRLTRDQDLSISLAGAPQTSGLHSFQTSAFPAMHSSCQQPQGPAIVNPEYRLVPPVIEDPLLMPVLENATRPRPWLDETSQSEQPTQRPESDDDTNPRYRIVEPKVIELTEMDAESPGEHSDDQSNTRPESSSPVPAVCRESPHHRKSFMETHL